VAAECSLTVWLFQKEIFFRRRKELEKEKKKKVRRVKRKEFENM
jgi:hypothetical protein